MSVASLVLALTSAEVAAQAIPVTPANPTISVGQAQQFTATGVGTVTAVDMGAFHSCALLQNGGVRCWGANVSGGLGDGTTTDSSTPVAVTGLTGAATVVSAGGYHTCARLADATVQCWGRNNAGQLGDPATLAEQSPTPVPVPGITATTVTAGGFHTCALFQDGTVRCWGANSLGQLGNGTSDPVPSEDAQTFNPNPVPVSGITGAVAISAGGWYTCALLGNGTIRCWGDNTYGQLGNGATIPPVPARGFSATPVTVSGITTAVAIDAGIFHMCALLRDGTAVCWGRNGDGRLGNGGTSASSTPTPVGPTPVPDFAPAALASGAEHTCAVLRDGRVSCWGDNNWGQLGNLIPPEPPMCCSPNPARPVIGITTAITASSGAEHTCVLLQGGTVSCWGNNNFGRVGVPLTDTRTRPCAASPSCAFVPLAVNGIGGTATWTSSNTAVATIDANGLATARGPGSTTITATSGGRSGSTILTVATRPALTVVPEGTGSGIVRSSDGRIVCGATCSAEYESGARVTLIAAADPGSTFQGWRGGCAGTGNCTVAITANTTVFATYTIVQQVATPTFSPAGGTYVGSVTVTLSNATSGATIYYTTDGSAPTPASTRYAGPIPVTQTTTLRALAAAAGMTDSAVASATYTIQPPPGVSAPALMWQYGGCIPGPYCGYGWYSSPAVVDLDGDGQPDVVWGSYDVVALNGTNGSLKWRGAGNNQRVWAATVVADLTGDGTPEVIVGRANGQVTVYDRAGGVVWTRTPFGAAEIRTLTVADLETDGQLEILVGRIGNTGTPDLIAYEPNGSVRPGWPVRRSGEPGFGDGLYNQNVVVADMNGNGLKEVFSASTGHYITAVDRNGNQLPANTVFNNISNQPQGPKVWSQVGLHVDSAVDLRGYANCGVEHRPDFSDSAPVVADVDGDGVPELIVVGNIYNCGTSPYTHLYQMPFILRLDRTRWSGSGFDWTVLPTPSPGSGPRSKDYTVIENALANPAVADLDGDGRMEIIYPSYDGKVHAYWLDKTEHGSWPYTIPVTGGVDDFRFASEPVIVDLNNDGRAEVIFTSWPKKATGGVGHLHILDYLGRELYRVSLPAPAIGSPWNGGLGAPTIANIDGDPDLEVVVGTFGSGVVAYKLPNSANARVLWGTGRGNYRRSGTAAPGQ